MILETLPNRSRTPESPTRSAHNLKVCLTATSGGHLSQLEAIRQSLGQYSLYLVTIQSPHSQSSFPGVERRYVRRIVRNPVNLLLNFLKSLSIIIRESPNAVVSTGAGETIPTMLLARALGVPVVFVESMARVHHPSLTGRLVRLWTDLIVVQWSSLQSAYPHCACAIPLFRPSLQQKAIPATPRIVVLTGSGTRGFNRLLSAVDSLVERGGLPRNVFAQIGNSSYTPRNFPYVRFAPHSQMLQVIENSDVVVTHDGSGAFGEALSAGRPTLVLPRRRSAGELTYRSTGELAQRLAQLGWITLISDPYRIPAAIAEYPTGQAHGKAIEGPTVGAILGDFLRQLERR